MKNSYSILAFLLLFLQLGNAQEHYYNDSFRAHIASDYTIDGVGDESFWEDCEWYNMDYVWIPYAGSMTAGDFTGRVKFAWTPDKLLILAEIEDDVLSDTHEAPSDNYWNDDCFEVFLDEDYSGGWHQSSYNAFAYHCSINEEDVIDSGDDDASNVNLKDHIEFDLDTIDETHYVWELAITLYDDSFNESNATNNTVTLTANKEMGIAVAYCDNDGGNERENFIGLVDVAEEHFNSAWQDASVFGKLTLYDPDYEEPNAISGQNLTTDILVFQENKMNLIIENAGNDRTNASVSIYAMNGILLQETQVKLEDRISIATKNLQPGTYIVKLTAEARTYSKMIYFR